MSKNKGNPPSQRQLRVGEEIRHILAQILLQESFYGSPLQGVSITVAEVRVSPDLKNATAYVSPLGGQAPDDFLSTLNAMVPQFRYEVGKRIKLRHVPQLHFKKDVSFDHALKIGKLLDSVRTADSSSSDHDA